MRALYLVLLVALCLPLQAGDPGNLERAIEMFRSPHPAARAEGSRLANKELRKLLAPLLNAMQDPDPEVRRRVREAILSLVPFHERATETQQERQLRMNRAQFEALKAWQVQIKKQKAVSIPRVQQQKDLLDAIKRQLVLRNKNTQKAARVLARFGVTGNFVNIANAGRGLRVDRVEKKSHAENAGLLPGDTILPVNASQFTSYEVFVNTLDPRRGWSGAKLKVLRAARIFQITLK